MRVLIVAQTFGRIINGPAKLLNILYATMQQNKEIDLHILTSSSLDKPMPNVHTISAKSWITNIKLPLGKIKHSLHYHLCVKNFLKTHENLKFDVIIYSDAANGFWSSLLGLNHHKIALMINDDTYLDASIESAVKTHKGRGNLLHRFLERSATKRPEMIVVCSHYLRKKTIKYYGLNESKVRVQRCGMIFSHDRITLSPKNILMEIDPQVTIKPTRKNFSSPINVLFVKSDQERGGLNELFHALTAIHGYKFCLTIIGPVKNSQTYFNWPYSEKIDICFLGYQPQKK